MFTENMKLLLGASVKNLIYADFGFDNENRKFDLTFTRAVVEVPTDDIEYIVEDIVSNLDCYDKLELLEEYDCRPSQLVEYHKDNIDEDEVIKIIMEDKSPLFEIEDYSLNDNEWVFVQDDCLDEEVLNEIELVTSVPQLLYIVNECVPFNNEETRFYDEIYDTINNYDVNSSHLMESKCIKYIKH